MICCQEELIISLFVNIQGHIQKETESGKEILKLFQSFRIVH